MKVGRGEMLLLLLTAKRDIFLQITGRQKEVEHLKTEKWVVCGR